MTPVRQRLRKALASGAFRRYLLVRAASQIGDGLFQQAAAAVLLFEQASSNPAMDLVRISAVVIVPFTLIGPFTGVAIDRLDRRKILVWTPIARAIFAIAIALTVIAGSKNMFLLAVLVVLSLNRFFLATLAAVLPQLVPEEDLVVANSASSTSGAVANVGGQAIGALTSEWLSGRTTSALASIGFIASGRLARDLPVHKGLNEAKAPLREEFRRVISETRDGFNEMQAAPRVRNGMVAITLLQFLVGVLVAILLHYLVAELGLGPSSGFSMLAVLAVGIGAGVLIVPWITERIELAATIRIAFLVGAFGTMLPLGSLSRPLMAVSAGMVGVAYALVKIPVDTIVQQDIDDEVRGRAFSMYDVIFNTARILGTAASAIVYELGVGTRAQMTVTTLGFAAVAVGLRVPGRPVYEPAADAPIIDPPEAEMRRTQPSKRELSNSILPPVGSLVYIVPLGNGRPEEEPAALMIDGAPHRVSMLWRGRRAEDGIERRVLGLSTDTYGVRVVADPVSGSWEITAIWSK